MPGRGMGERLAIDPNRNNTLYLGAPSGNGLWRSTDAGLSFTKLSNVEEADAVGFGRAATGGSYVAIYVSAKIDGVRGLYRSARTRGPRGCGSTTTSTSSPGPGRP